MCLSFPSFYLSFALKMLVMIRNVIRKKHRFEKAGEVIPLLGSNYLFVSLLEITALA